MNFSVDANHILCKNGKPVTQKPTPNRGGKMNVRRFLICHFTAGSTAAGAISWMCDADSKVSAHFVIARPDGKVTQLAPCNVICWHAGKSRWKHAGKIYESLNSCTIGIEFDNTGRLLPSKSGGWVTDYGKEVEEADVLVARHKHDPQSAKPSGWQTYSDVQIEVGLGVAAALIERYNLDAVLGHDDISPGRKNDPGPAFPLVQFQMLTAEAAA